MVTGKDDALKPEGKPTERLVGSQLDLSETDIVRVTVQSEAALQQCKAPRDQFRPGRLAELAIDVDGEASGRHMMDDTAAWPLLVLRPGRCCRQSHSAQS